MFLILLLVVVVLEAVTIVLEVVVLVHTAQIGIMKVRVVDKHQLLHLP